MKRNNKNKVFNYIKKLMKDKYIKVVFISLIMIAMYLVFYNPIILMTENQILYTFSSSAQVIAALYGLMFTGYIFFEGRMRENVLESNDDVDEDFLTSIKKDYHQDILVLSCISAWAIGLCIAMISITSYDFFDNKEMAYFINTTLLLIFLSIISIISFSLKVTNPDSIMKFTSKSKVNIEKNLQNTTDGSKRKEFIKKSAAEKYSDFIMQYNELEFLVTEYIKRLNLEDVENSKYALFKSVEVLKKTEIIDSFTEDDFKSLRKYRNALVHGRDYSVNYSLFVLVDNYVNVFRNIYNNDFDLEESKELINSIGNR